MKSPIAKITKITYDSLNNYFIDFTDGGTYNSSTPCSPEIKSKYDDLIIYLFKSDLDKGVSINDMVYVPDDLDYDLCRIKTIVSYFEDYKILTQHYYLESMSGDPLSLTFEDIETIPQRRNNLINNILK